MIKIDKEPFSTYYFYSGTYTKDTGDDAEYREEIYDFTIQDMGDYQNLEWLEDVPDDSNDIEKLIIKQFNREISG